MRVIALWIGLAVLICSTRSHCKDFGLATLTKHFHFHLLFTLPLCIVFVIMEMKLMTFPLSMQLSNSSTLPINTDSKTDTGCWWESGGLRLWKQMRPLKKSRPMSGGAILARRYKHCVPRGWAQSLQTYFHPTSHYSGRGKNDHSDIHDPSHISIRLNS